METLKLLTRSEMRKIGGGSGTDPENCTVTCDNCTAEHCQNVPVDDCATGIIQVCGIGFTWDDSPQGWCTCIDPE